MSFLGESSAIASLKIDFSKFLDTNREESFMHSNASPMVVFPLPFRPYIMFNLSLSSPNSFSVLKDFPFGISVFVVSNIFNPIKKDVFVKHPVVEVVPFFEQKNSKS